MVRAVDIASLSRAYESGTDPVDVITELHGRILRAGIGAVWIMVPTLDDVLARLDAARRRRDAGAVLPLYGIPFAVKDNIDVGGWPTTAGCPAFSHVASRSATVVQKLEAAGAIPLGKNNLDQFATGLVGTRSPYGIPSSVFNPDYISGGSSSGSGVAVAQGLVSFALGTDTAGSGRVPAAFNNIVGVKPTRGWLSTLGLVPACRSLDCVSVFAGTVEDAMAAARIAAGFDPEDPFSRRAPDMAARSGAPSGAFSFGVPAEPLEFFGDGEAHELYAQCVARLKRLGGLKTPIDFTPFREACQLLYDGPWVAERLATLKDFAARYPEAILPVTRDIILGGGRLSAVDAFDGFHRLAALARRAEAVWSHMDVMLLPTTGTTYRIAEVQADPIRLNSNLGLYTNFVNLLDLSAVAIPAGFRSNGLPFGVTLMAPAFRDEAVAATAGRLHRALVGATIGATGQALPPVAKPAQTAPTDAAIEIAVLGAHLSGEPLNHELTQLGARLARSVRTAAGYSLYELPQAKPGLVYDGEGAGLIEVEIWRVPDDQLGTFVADIPPPLGIGTIALEDGSRVKGFLCEAHAVTGAKDITRFGGWRAFCRRAAGA